MPARFVPATMAALAMLTLVGAYVAPAAEACGGFFCTNDPVDQNAERIIFTMNEGGTVSAYIQIEYAGSAPFSWILPLPEAIRPDAVEVPADAMAAFRELEIATDPIFIPPPAPQCALALAAGMVRSEGDVDVVASGEVGPYSFDVVRSADPDALVHWLRDNAYLVTEQMEPLIDVYVAEQFVFLAMRLSPEYGVQDIEPVKVTYPSNAPMIPLRLTAVAANPNMAVMTWIFANARAVPTNYARMTISDDAIVFTGFGGGSNYRELMALGADAYHGQAFATEYAAPTEQLAVTHPLLLELKERFAYVTRLNTVISPEEMTVDPVFGFDASLPDVSNIHDLSERTDAFDCQQEGRPRVAIADAVALVTPEPAVPTAELRTATAAATQTTTGPAAATSVATTPGPAPAIAATASHTPAPQVRPAAGDPGTGQTGGTLLLAATFVALLVLFAGVIVLRRRRV